MSTIGSTCDNIYLQNGEERGDFFEKTGGNPVKIVMSDIFEEGDSHGRRVRSTLLHTVRGLGLNDRDFNLFSFQGVESQSINAIRTDETVIISSSAHFSDTDMIRQQSYDDVEALKTKNALMVCSLENPGVDGRILPDGSYEAYEYPHAGIAYASENDREARRKMIFACAATQEINGVLGHVDIHGGFVFNANNILDTLFVLTPLGIPASNSHAAALISAYTAKILKMNPDLTAEELKRRVLDNAPYERIDIRDTYYAGFINGEHVYRPEETWVYARVLRLR